MRFRSVLLLPFLIAAALISAALISAAQAQQPGPSAPQPLPPPPAIAPLVMMPVPVPPQGWGLSRTLPPDLRVRQLQMDIDVVAGTVMTGYDGTPASVPHLAYDVTNLAYRVRPGAEALVIGAGGHRCPVARALGEVSGREEVVIAQESETRLSPEWVEALGEWQGAVCPLDR